MNIKAVARMAGVSVATISRVLNHPERVLPETRRRVLAIMQEQDYTPNWFARGLNLAKTGTIALLVPTIEDGTYQRIVAGVETVAQNKAYAVFLCNTRGDTAVEHNYLKMVLTRRVDGVLMAGSTLGAEEADVLPNSGVPVVHVGERCRPGQESVCYLDFREGIARLMRHLNSLGHRTIDVLLAEPPSAESERIAGWLTTVETAPLPSPHAIHYGANTQQGGYAAARRLIENGRLPAALITFSDEQAFGVMRAVRDRGLTIPGDLALAAMTDSGTCALVSPPLTTLEQPAQRLGMVAARMLFDKIEQDELEPESPRTVVLQPKLKIRNSCGNTKLIYELQD